MEEIRKFLSEPEEHQDEFWESDALIWVDWRDFDESIINYFNERMVSAHRSPTQMIVPTVTLR